MKWTSTKRAMLGSASLIGVSLMLAGVTACSSGGTAPATSSNVFSTPDSGATTQSAACADWSQAHTDSNLDDGGGTMVADVQTAIDDSTDPVLTGYLQSWMNDYNDNDLGAFSGDIKNIDAYCGN
jgi:hypothetical protein